MRHDLQTHSPDRNESAAQAEAPEPEQEAAELLGYVLSCDNLIAALSRAAEQLSSFGVTVRSLADVEVLMHPGVRAQIQFLRSEVSRCADLQRLSHRYASLPFSGLTPITDDKWTLSLLSAVLTSVSADQAVNQALSFAAHPVSEVVVVQTLYGVKLQEPIRLAEGISIVPTENVPASKYRDQFFINADNSVARHNSFGPAFARAAITVEVDRDPAVIEGGAQSQYVPSWQKSESFVEESIQQAVAAIALTGLAPEACYRFCHAMHPGHPVPNGNVLWKAAPSSITILNRDLPVTECLDLFDLVRRFAQPKDLYRLVTRLVHARIERDPVDAHLDFGIVAEAALTRGDNTKSEVLQRLKTRAAWFLGRDIESRRSYAKKIDRLYGLRSAAAHTGSLPSGKGGWTMSDKTAADELCNELLVCSLKRGKFVDQDEWSGMVYG